MRSPTTPASLLRDQPLHHHASPVALLPHWPRPAVITSAPAASDCTYAANSSFTTCISPPNAAKCRGVLPLPTCMAAGTMSRERERQLTQLSDGWFAGITYSEGACRRQYIQVLVQVPVCHAQQCPKGSRMSVQLDIINQHVQCNSWVHTTPSSVWTNSILPAHLDPLKVVAVVDDPEAGIIRC